MKKDGLNYSMVNVIRPHGGYSFMVTTKWDNVTKEEIIDACKDMKLFQEDDDWEYAETDDLVDEYDINMFKDDFTFNLD